ncbi:MULTISPECIES: hypothetical protein [Yersinia]|uniref:hypothetical protein n=1 Tax=Yersinia TaxID=629 RepID=UPI0005DC923A|nr:MULTISPECIES: hypothetical protein [Yersinia]OVZ97201.1 hypothetical protein CBW53_10865 [Yersinia frederiksenii]RXA95232.1 hypothetical protein EQP49_14900 [Yersinia sp. 2105 StPb PI]CNI19385.1 Uncharacterised protein [Yersinia frederiksenii]CNI57652.1 Uncharacterised protein [Yersinia frederiksenii]CNK87252.1 Uncharacterised protein [Yersinia frederiksenii]
MRKKIIQLICFSAFLGGVLGYGVGRGYYYFHPMSSIEGYWEVNYDFSHLAEKYHVYSRVSIMKKEINSSADVYDDTDDVKARRNIIFNVVDVSKNIFIGKVLSLSMINDENRYLYDFLNTPYAVSHPVFYKLNDDTILMEQSQGHPVNNLRLMTRIDV